MLRRSSVCYSNNDYRRVIIAAYKVPSNVHSLKRAESNVLNSAVVAAISGLSEHEPNRSICWVGYQSSDLFRSSDDIESSPSEGNHNSNIKVVPVQLTERQVRTHFRDFCKGLLWPLFHYYGNTKSFNKEVWKAYCDVNQKFADAVRSVYQPGDIIFIQDYHLMMVPEMLRKTLPDAKIGFFLHTPWPSSELYRALPVRDLILKSLVTSDIIGFQAYSFSRHFMSACTRILGLTANDRGIECDNGHFVTCEVIPVGIDANQCLNSLQKDKVKARIEELKKTYAGKKIIVSRDGTEYINGIPQKLKAFQTFLEKNPDLADKVVLIQLCRPNSDMDRVYGELCETIEKLVGSINGQFGSVADCPLLYFQKNFSFDDICAMFAIADVALITPLRDGMNVTAFEFTACQEEKMSPLILSEFAGAAGCLPGAMLVNPWDTEKVSRLLYEALTMTDDYKKLRHYHNFNYVNKHTAYYWISNFLKLETNTNSRKFDMAPALPIDDLLHAYENSGKRLIFLDYDGTLTPKKRLPQEAVPTQETLDLIKSLALEVKNNVYVVSGRDRKFLEEHFGGMRIGLAAEHGNFLRKPPPLGEEKDFVWEERSANFDLRWKEDVLKIFQAVVDVTPGSFIEEKEINIAWHYRNADPEFAEWQMRELLVHLQGLPKSPIDILNGSKNVEVRPKGVNKGTFVRGVMVEEKDVDFVLCIGDDKTDEDMFLELKLYPNLKYLFSATVEKKPTTAMFYLDEQPKVTQLLRRLVENPYTAKSGRR